MFTQFLQDYNISVLIENIRKRLVWIIAAAVLCAGLAYYYASANSVDYYTSYVTLYVSTLGTGSNSNSSGTSTPSKDFGSSTSLASTYKVILSERSVASLANEKLSKYSKSDDQLNGATTISVMDDTQLIKISVTSSDANFSCDACKAYSDIAPSVLENILNGGSVKVITEPKVATSPESKDYKTYALYGGVAGLGISLIIVIIMFAVDNTMKSSEEISSKYGIKVWAEIPSFGIKTKTRQRNSNINDSRDKIINSETPFLVIEAYKIARTNMAHTLSDISTDRGCAIIMTSFEPSAGKSLTSANMAITMAKRDRKVLLVDADMRKPMQNKLFDIPNDKGLSSVLTGKESPAQCIFRLQENLHIMPSGKIPPNPSELIDSRVMMDLIEAMEQVYDYIIIDTPPVGMVTDASALAPKIDGVCLVARQKSTASSEFQRAVETLSKVEASVIGAIFTDVSGYSKSYGKYRYRNGYRYRYKYRYDNYEYKEKDTHEIESVSNTETDLKTRKPKMSRRKLKKAEQALPDVSDNKADSSSEN